LAPQVPASFREAVSGNPKGPEEEGDCSGQEKDCGPFPTQDPANFVLLDQSVKAEEKC